MKKLLLLSLVIYSVTSTAQLIQPNLLTPSKTEKVNRDTSNKNVHPRITFYGMTSLNSSDEDIINNITASGRLAVNFTPRKDGRLSFNIAANLINTGSRTEKKDSVDFNSLMFPETGNFGFMFNPSIIVAQKGDRQSKHSLLLDGTYSYRKISLDSPVVSFKINSVNVGVKYVWDYENPENDQETFTFTLMGYWNLFNVPDEDVKRFNTIMKDTLFEKVNSNAEIHSIGLKSTIQYKNFIFFADLRRNIKTKELDDDNPFKGTKFNIGFATYFRLKTIK